MALYHFSVKPIKRSAGRSATASAAYRSGEIIHDERTGLTWDYSNKERIDHKELVGFSGTREQLWNAAEQAEKRKDACVAREYQVALQRELSYEDNLALVREYAEWMHKRYGVASDICVHNFDDVNPHAHILTTTREVDEKGIFGEKSTREKSGTDRRKLGLCSADTELKNARKEWADICNRGFERAGLDIRIDERSLKDQGIDRPPTEHRGPKVDAMLKRGVVVDLEEYRAERAAQEAEQERQAQAELVALQKALQQVQGDMLAIDARRFNPEYEYSGPPEKERDTPPGDEGEQGGQYRMDRTYLAVRRQLEAMGCDLYEVGISNPETGNIPSREWTKDQVLKSVGYLKSQNLKGSNIYIRPAGDHSAGLFLLDDLNQSQLKTLEQQGFNPATTVETSPQNYQAWVRISDKGLSDNDLANEVSRQLTREAGGDPGAIGWRQYGRLAGFTNRKAQHIQEDGKPPWVLCHNAAGKQAEQGEHLLRACEQILQAREQSRTEKPGDDGQEKTRSRTKAGLDLNREYDLQLAALQARYGGKTFDHSRADFMITKNLLKRGAGDSDMQKVLSDKADRKGDYAKDYAERTVKQARGALVQEMRRKRRRGLDYDL